MICSAVCALMMLAALADAACRAATANSVGFGRWPRLRRRRSSRVVRSILTL